MENSALIASAVHVIETGDSAAMIAKEIERLLDAGLDVNARDEDDSTPLHLAVANISSDAVGLLIEKGADVNAKDFLGTTPLHLACRYGFLENVLALLDAGADVNVWNADGFSPAHDAMNNDNLLVALCLLEHGADPVELFDTIVKYCPEENIDDDDVLETSRGLLERIIDWYRENHPEMVMERYCTQSAVAGLAL